MNIDEQVYFEDFFTSRATTNIGQQEAAAFTGDITAKNTFATEGLFTLSKGARRSFDGLTDREVRDACFELAELPLPQQIPYILSKTGLDGLFGARQRVINGKVYCYGLPLATAPFDKSGDALQLPPKLKEDLGLTGTESQVDTLTSKYEYWGGAGEAVNRFFFHQYKAYHYHDLVAEFEAELETSEGGESDLLLLEQWGEKLQDMARALKVTFPELSLLHSGNREGESLSFPSNCVAWQKCHAGGMLAAVEQMQVQYLYKLRQQLDKDRAWQDEQRVNGQKNNVSYARAHYLVHSGLYDIVRDKIGSQHGAAKLLAPVAGCSFTTLRQYIIRIKKGYSGGSDDALFYPVNLQAAVELLKDGGKSAAAVEEDLRKSKKQHGALKGRGRYGT